MNIYFSDFLWECIYNFYIVQFSGFFYIYINKLYNCFTIHCVFIQKDFLKQIIFKYVRNTLVLLETVPLHRRGVPRSVVKRRKRNGSAPLHRRGMSRSVVKHRKRNGSAPLHRRGVSRSVVKRRKRNRKNGQEIKTTGKRVHNDRKGKGELYHWRRLHADFRSHPKKYCKSV